MKNDGNRQQKKKDRNQLRNKQGGAYPAKTTIYYPYAKRTATISITTNKVIIKPHGTVKPINPRHNVPRIFTKNISIHKIIAVEIKNNTAT